MTAAGADAGRVFDERDRAAVGETIEKWGRLAQAAGVNGVPMFFVGPRGGALQRVALTSITVPEFRAALDAALAR